MSDAVVVALFTFLGVVVATLGGLLARSNAKSKRLARAIGDVGSSVVVEKGQVVASGNVTINNHAGDRDQPETASESGQFAAAIDVPGPPRAKALSAPLLDAAGYGEVATLRTELARERKAHRDELARRDAAATEAAAEQREAHASELAALTRGSIDAVRSLAERLEALREPLEGVPSRLDEVGDQLRRGFAELRAVTGRLETVIERLDDQAKARARLGLDSEVE